MGLVRGFLLALILSIVFISNFSQAYDLQYSIGPRCRNNKVICKNPNEVPTCLKLEPKVHIELVNYINGERKNRYEPFCDFPNSSHPKCTDALDAKNVLKNVFLECVEYIQCKTNDINDKLAASCSSGKTPKCIGENNEPDCESETVCESNSLPVCDYTWQANALGSGYH